MKENTFEANIRISSRKVGYVTHPETEETHEIQESYLNHALFGDLVKVQVLDPQGDAPQGRVIEIVDRARTHFMGTLEKHGAKGFLKADSRKMYVDIYLDEEETAKAQENDKVYVEMIEWPDHLKNPTGVIRKVLGQKGEHEVEMQSILLDRGIDTDFPDAVDQEAHNVQAHWLDDRDEEIARRRDMRETTTFTIDPKTAKDFDDALSIKKLENGNWEIGVHIADVSHFVRPGTELDREAFERSFSTYLVDRTIPMLPEVLSNDLCSLNPDEERFAFSAVFEMNDNSEVLDKWFGRTIIRSDKRFSYEEAQAVRDNGDGIFLEELNIMQELARKMRKQKFNNGAIKFESDEFEFELDQNKVPVAVHKREHIEAHWLIEEFMLLANKQVALFFEEKLPDASLMYRVHDGPNPERLADLAMFLKALGYNLKLDKEGLITPQQLNDLLQSVIDKPEEGLVSSAAIKTMSKAIYSPQNTGHFGLAFDYYTHFTSPIRRYPDLLVHRILQAILDGTEVSEKDQSYFEKAAAHASEQEVVAANAERDSVRFKQIEFMQTHVGEEFDGIISGVANFGCFVMLTDSGAEGMVHISKLGEDFYEFQEKKYRIVGEKNGEVFTLGDQVRVRVAEVDLDNKKMSLVIVKK